MSRAGDVPIPGSRTSAVAVPAPGDEPGSWAGASSAALDADGSIWLAYRVRVPDRRGSAVVLARSDDGERFATVSELPRERFGAESLERPALVRTAAGRWQLYMSCATPGSKHWRVDVLEAASPERLAGAQARPAWPGDEHWGVKDPVVLQSRDGWQAWVCCHPLDEPGEEDRMLTRHAVSADGLRWSWDGDALAPRQGTWDARGTRVTAVLPAAGVAYYDGRASAAENFHERTGLAAAAGGGTYPLARLRALGDAPVAAAPVGDGALRYLDVLPLPGGAHRLYYEAARPDGAHELRTELISPGGSRRRS